MVGSPRGVPVMPPVPVWTHTVFPYTPLPGYPGYTTAHGTPVSMASVVGASPRNRPLGSGACS